MEAWRLPCLLFHAAFLAFSNRLVLGQKTLCSAQGLCYTLHPSQLTYQDAKAACGPRGELTSMKDEGERQNILLLFEDVAQQGLEKFWIGLSKPASQCVVKEKPLRGFQWVSGKEASDVDMWATDPQLTCTSAKCVALQRSVSEPRAWHWKEYFCSKSYPYICRHEYQGVCASHGVPHATVLTSQSHHRAANESNVLSPPGTNATAVCHSGEQNVSVTCQQQASSYQWISMAGRRPICSCPAGYKYSVAGECTLEYTVTAQGHRPCNKTHPGLTCDDHGGPIAGKELGSAGMGPETGSNEQSMPQPGKGVTPQPGEGAPGPSERITAEPGLIITPGPTPYGKDMIHTTSGNGSLLTVNDTASPSSFSEVLVPVVIATVALGLITMFVIFIFKVCFRRRGRNGKRPTAQNQGDPDPEENNASSVQHPEQNGV